MNRRTFLRRSLSAGTGYLVAGSGPAVITAESARPRTPCGVQSGEVGGGRATVWSRSDMPARMIVEYATTPSFDDARRVAGPAALEAGDFTAKVRLSGLPRGQEIFYRVTFESLLDPGVLSPPATGQFRTAPAERRDILFAWSGDTAGQGWGINLEWGGMRIYETMSRLEPDFFIHSGDLIYADNPIPAEIPLENGQVWKNVVTPEKSKVAETLDEFRGNYRYNLLDENLRRFNSRVAQLVQWDDHETRNNWYPGCRIEDERYTIRSCDLLAARGRRAFFDYTPLRPHPLDPERIYRAVRYGPSLEVFLLDQRSYRGPNSANRQAERSAATAFLGAEQLRWLKSRLLASRATWKVIAADMPIGIVVRDGPEAFENAANGDGPPLGRELEVADLLRFIRDSGIRNTVWLTADVHHAAAIHYDPARARFTDFDPFWEFVAGPLHAGTFGPGLLDDTFGPERRFLGIPPGMKQNRPPSDGFQFFGTVRIDGRTEALTVKLHDLEGKVLYDVDLPPDRREAAAGR